MKSMESLVRNIWTRWSDKSSSSAVFILLISVAILIYKVLNQLTLAVVWMDWNLDVICWTLTDILVSPLIWTKSEESSLILSNSASFCRKLRIRD
jgi:hypothetical protein